MVKMCLLFPLTLLVTLGVTQARSFSSLESSGEYFSDDDFFGFGAGRGHPLGGTGFGQQLGGGFGRPLTTLGSARPGIGLPAERRFEGAPLSLESGIDRSFGTAGGSHFLREDIEVSLPIGGPGSYHIFGSDEVDFPLGAILTGLPLRGNTGIDIPAVGVGEQAMAISGGHSSPGRQPLGGNEQQPMRIRSEDISFGSPDRESFANEAGIGLPSVDNGNGKHPSEGDGEIQLPAAFATEAGLGVSSVDNGNDKHPSEGTGEIRLPAADVGYGGSDPVGNDGNGGSNGGTFLPLGNGNDAVSLGKDDNGESPLLGGEGSVDFAIEGGDNGPLLGSDTGVGLPTV